MPHHLTPSLLFLLAAGSLHAQVGVEGTLPPSVGSAEIQAAIGSDESKAGLEKASQTPGKTVAGTVTEKDIEEVAKIKMPDLNANDLEAAKQQVRGTARSMGLTVK